MQQQQQGQQNPIDTLKTLWMWTWWIASLHAAAPMHLLSDITNFHNSILRKSSQ